MFNVFLLAFLACATLFAGVKGTEVSTAVTPTPKANPMIIDGILRLSIIDEGCVRLERGTFHDEETMFGQKREMDFFDFEIEDKDDQILVKTKSIIFFVDRNHPEGAMPDHNFGVHMPGIVVWRPSYGKPKLHNLGGSTGTLDSKWESFELDDGLMTREGWFLYDDTGKPLVVDGEAKVRDVKEGDMDVYFFCYGKDYQKGLRELCDVSGKIPMPPRFTFGSWYSRWYSYTSDDYRNLVREYEEKGYPLDVLVWDMEWHDRKATKGFWGDRGWTGWTWNRDLLPDAEALLKEMRDKGLHIALNVHPADGIRDHEWCYEDFMKALGESTEGGRIIPFQAGNKKYMDAYFKYAHEPLEKEGVDVWWVDWQQDSLYPYVSGVPGLKHWTWLNRLYYEHTDKPDQRGLSFARWGGLGDQKYPIEFSGDTGCCWPMLAFEIAMNSCSANAGCCYWSHDMGGHYGRRDPELYARWLQFGATTASFRLHSTYDKNLDRRPWLWGEFEPSLKKSYELRSQLLPYIYTGAHKLYEECLPFMRPLYYDFPNDENSYINPQEYLLGEHMLSAPITQPGRGSDWLASQVVYFPSDGWADYFTGESYDKGYALVARGIMEMPLFVKKGTPLPLGRMGNRMADLPETVDIVIFPTDGDGEGSFSLYEDDGITPNYKKGEYAFTNFRYIRQLNSHFVFIGDQRGGFEGQVKDRSYTVTIRNVSSFDGALFNGEPVETEYSAADRAVKVYLPKGAEGKLNVSAAVAPREDVGRDAVKARAEKLDPEDKEGRLLAGGCGLGKTDESRYYLDGKEVWRFFPGGQTDSFTLKDKDTGCTAEYRLAKGSCKPQLMPPGNWTLEVDGVEVKKP